MVFSNNVLEPGGADQAERKRVQAELKTMLREAKDSYRRKVGAEAAGKPHERGVGWHENHHRLQEEQQHC